MNKPVIKVYFETPNGSYATQVATFTATFTADEHYDACYPMLKKIAEKQGYIVTVSVPEFEDAE